MKNAFLLFKKSCRLQLFAGAFAQLKISVFIYLCFRFSFFFPRFFLLQFFAFYQASFW